MDATVQNHFSPFEIRGKRFKNRVFFSPYGTAYKEGGALDERGPTYSAARRLILLWFWAMETCAAVASGSP
jgi:2,4-dienoyl-CoA reductase-like NADH-dependent reductase (Old Yellow Enzyme family)